MLAFFNALVGIFSGQVCQFKKYRISSFARLTSIKQNTGRYHKSVKKCLIDIEKYILYRTIGRGVTKCKKFAGNILNSCIF